MSTPDGGDATVTAVHKLGMRPVFRIVTADHAETRATATHRWEMNGPRGTRIMTTAEIGAFARNSLNAWHLPAIKTIQYAPRDVTLDPWLVGFLIGDGCLSVESTVAFSTADPEIVERVQATVGPQFTVALSKGTEYTYIIRATVWGAAKVRPEQNIRFKLGGYEAALAGQYLGRFKNREDAVAAKAVAIKERYGDLAVGESLQTQLRAIGLMGKRAYEKRIPEEYRYNTEEVRLEMLRGILDSDGHVGERGYIVLDQTSEQLALDVQELVEGLGGIARIIKAPRRENPLHRQSWRMSIRHPKVSSLVWLPRKKERAERMDGNSRTLRRIVDVIPDGEAEVQCIEIDSPRRLYLTDHSLPTHNSKAGKRSPA